MIVRPTSQIPADATPLNMYLVDNHIVVAMPDHLVAPKPAAKPAAKHARVLTDASADERAGVAAKPATTRRRKTERGDAAAAPSDVHVITPTASAQSDEREKASMHVTPAAAPKRAHAPAEADARPKRAMKDLSAAPAAPAEPAAMAQNVATLFKSFKKMQAKAGTGDNKSVKAYAWICAAHAAGGRSPGADKPPNTFNHSRKDGAAEPVAILTDDKDLTPDAMAAMDHLLAARSR